MTRTGAALVLTLVLTAPAPRALAPIPGLIPVLILDGESTGPDHDWQERQSLRGVGDRTIPSAHSMPDVSPEGSALGAAPVSSIRR